MDHKQPIQILPIRGGQPFTDGSEDLAVDLGPDPGGRQLVESCVPQQLIASWGHLQGGGPP